MMNSSGAGILRPPNPVSDEPSVLHSAEDKIILSADLSERGPSNHFFRLLSLISFQRRLIHGHIHTREMLLTSSTNM